jgi:biotin-dependent carboxylase-like uncharacterized protein
VNPRRLLVEKAGPLTTVQDEGRPGYAHLGVPHAGALDRPALRLANRLVGNPDDAAALEITVGGFAATCERSATIALTGAHAPLRVGGRAVPLGAPVAVRPGARVEVGRAVAGLRAYLAVDGGLAAEPVLGSRSTDTLAWIGPPPVRDGSVLPLGPPREPSTVDVAPVEALAGTRGWEVRLRVRLGPRDDWFTPAALEKLGSSRYRITEQSNRIGARLSGPALTRAVAGELPSEGIVLGAVQVPANGEPLVFLADHPTTGGYPVIGVVDAADLPALAQARPGDTVRFCGPQQ